MKEYYRRMLVRVALVLISAVLIFTVGIRALWLLMPFLLAYVAAWLLEPVAAWLERRLHLPRMAAAILVVVLATAVVLAIVVGYLGLLSAEAARLADSWQDLASAADALLLTVRSWVLAPFDGNLRNMLSALFSALSDALMRTVPVLTDAATDWAADAVMVLPSALLGALVMIMATFLMIGDYRNLSAGLQSMMQKELFAPFVRMAKIIRSIFGGYLFAAVVMAVAVSLVDMAGLLLLGVQYAALLALVMGVLDFLPYVGSGLILVPWCLYCMLTGDFIRAAGLAMIYLVVFLLRNVLGRRVLGERYRHNNLLMLLWVFLGWKLYGIGGMILAQMLGMMAANIYRDGMLRGTLEDLGAIWHDLVGRFRPLKSK